MIKKIKRFFRKNKMAFLQLAVYLFTIFLAVLAVCFILGLPEIIATLICGY